VPITAGWTRVLKDRPHYSSVEVQQVPGRDIRSSQLFGEVQTWRCLGSNGVNMFHPLQVAGHMDPRSLNTWTRLTVVPHNEMGGGGSFAIGPITISFCFTASDVHLCLLLRELVGWWTLKKGIKIYHNTSYPGLLFLARHSSYRRLWNWNLNLFWRPLVTVLLSRSSRQIRQTKGQRKLQQKQANGICTHLFVICK